MKILIIIFTFCVAKTFGKITPTNKKTLNINNECLTEYGINPELYYPKQSDVTIFTNEQMYCIAACVYKEYGVIKSDGTIDIDKVKTYFDEENYKEKDIFFTIFNECTKDKRDCKLVQCIFEKLKDHWNIASNSNIIEHLHKNISFENSIVEFL